MLTKDTGEKKELAYVAVQCVNCYNIFGGYLITYIKS